jgi:hypothetical protein
LSAWDDPTVTPFPKKKPAGGPPPDDDPLLCEVPIFLHVKDIPPRQWALGYFLLFGSVSAIGAVDGSGKGALAVVIALAMITGREDLLGEKVWESGPVAIITYEDSRTEWQRRIAAACLHYSIDYESVITSFRFIYHKKSRVVFAEHGSRGNVAFPDGDRIIEHLKDIGAALLIIDPFNHAHRLTDGNSNAQIAQVADEITRIAEQSTAAVLVLHHLRKGSNGAADDFLGAIALRATFRAVRILARMTTQEAEGLSIPAKEVWRHVRLAATKENYSPPPELATWYRLASVDLNNPEGVYTYGDNVQVMTMWKVPSAFEGLLLTTIADIFADIQRGPRDAPDEFFSPDPRANRWVGNIIIAKASKTAKEAGRIVKTWIKNRVLIKDTYHSPERREDIPCVTLNEAIAAEIVGPIMGRPETDE